MTTSKVSKRILSVTIERMIDTDADSSYLGKFSDEYANDYSIVHVGEHSGEFVCDVPDNELPYRGRTLRYFNPNVGNYDGESDEDKRKYCLQDYERADSLGSSWWYIGIRAEANIVLRASGVQQLVSSGGLWGIESDSDESYLEEIISDEIATLKRELHALGFSKRAITAAFRDVQHKDR